MATYPATIYNMWAKLTSLSVGHGWQYTYYYKKTARQWTSSRNALAPQVLVSKSIGRQKHAYLRIRARSQDSRTSRTKLILWSSFLLQLFFVCPHGGGVVELIAELARVSAVVLSYIVRSRGLIVKISLNSPVFATHVDWAKTAAFVKPMIVN